MNLITTVIWHDAFAGILVRKVEGGYDIEGRREYSSSRSHEAVRGNAALSRALRTAKAEAVPRRAATLRRLGDPIRRVILTPYAKGKGPSFTLTLWDAGTRAHTGQWQVGYRLVERLGERRTVLFEGADIGISPMHAIDSDEAVRGVLGWLTLKPGDTDTEHFADYTERQLDFAVTHGEHLDVEASYRWPDEQERKDQLEARRAEKALKRKRESETITEDPSWRQ